MASLVHDDLVDGAAVRHHRASINAKWGPEIAVALGDYVCAQAMATICECGDPRLFAVLGQELSAMCVGEMLQVADRAGLRLSERRCLAVIEDKTASLFGACCETGVIVAAGKPQARKALRQFGIHLGVAFQILDDCRDLLGDEKDLGKEPGQDLRAGDVTLPLLYGVQCSALRRGSRSAPARHQIEPQELASLIAAFRSSQAPERVRQLAESHLQAARMHLAAVRPSDCRESLHRLTDHLAVSLYDILGR
jgi:geranylgeranyl pyrophosphate synthase